MVAWRRCALDLVCAANTIRSYINRFGKVRHGQSGWWDDKEKSRSPAEHSHTAAELKENLIREFHKDCNGDQLVTCEDYVMIHKNGGWNCGKSLQGSKFWNIFQTCKDVVISRGLNI